MRVVIDANIAAAALVTRGGWTDRQTQREDLNLFAPSVLTDEMTKHATELAAKAECSLAEWGSRAQEFVERLEIVRPRDYTRHWNHEFVQAVASADADDAPYAAVFVAVVADFLWTRDRRVIAADPAHCVAFVPEP